MNSVRNIIIENYNLNPIIQQQINEFSSQHNPGQREYQTYQQVINFSTTPSISIGWKKIGFDII